jgi:RNA polymerase sigma-70 factor (ECF subfamily)
MILTQPDFAALAVEHFDALYGLARRLSRDPARADDLVQETFLRALRARESFHLESFGIRPWLMRILHNLHVTRSIRESRQPMAVEEEILERVPGDNSSGSQCGLLAADDMDEELVWAINALPDSYRPVLWLWAVEGKSYAEIAGLLSIPVGTVMSRLHRARKRIIDQLRQPTSGSHSCVHIIESDSLPT